jgi:dTDP-4-dehydrorhamnose reductase
VFSSHGRNFVTTMLGLGSGQNEVRVVADQTGAPTSARDIATTVAAIASRVSDGSGVWGTFHFASLEPVTWHGFAEAIFKAAGRIVKVIPITTIEFGARAMRPANSVLDCTHIFDAYGIRQPSWRAALNDVIAELNPAAST